MNPHTDPLAGSATQDPSILAMARYVATPGSVTTWLNHWSLLNAQWESLGAMTGIGIDGTLMQLTLKKAGAEIGRSSADLVLPVVLEHHLAPEDRIALIGAAPGVAQKAAARLVPRPVMCVDGFEGLAHLRAHLEELVEYQPRLVIVGLGAGLQEEVAAEVAELLPEASVCTAGGWIDQFAAKEQYFPPIIHRLRLGWAWRIAKEPRRLLRRYTTDAVIFRKEAPALIRRLAAITHRSPYALLVNNMGNPGAENRKGSR